MREKRDTSEKRRYAYVFMSITLDLPLIICNLSNLSFYRLLALLQGTFTETRDEQCACCIRDEHTCGLYLIH